MADEPEGTASGKTPESPTGKETEVNGSIADINFDDVPENIREAVKAKVASKAKSFQSDYSKKTEEVASLRKKLEQKESNLGEWIKLKDAIDKNPDLAKALNKTWVDFDSGKLGKSPEKATKAGKLLDRLIDQTDDSGYKEDLRRMREIIREETDTSSLTDEIKILKEELKLVKSTTRSVHTDKVDRELGALESRFGAELVGKYIDQIRPLAINKGYSVYSVFKSVVSDEDLQTAFLNEVKEKEKQEVERRKKGLEPSGAGVIPKVEMPKDGKGRADWRKFAGNIVRKHGLDKEL